MFQSYLEEDCSLADDNSSGTGGVSSEDNDNDDDIDDENDTNGVRSGLNSCQLMSEINSKTVTQSQ